MSWMRRLSPTILGAMCLQLCGCVTVKQVNRGILAKKIMSFNPESKKTAFLNDIHAIREGAQGGGDQGAGGGCGCN
jgi:Domain of unknown function (DUF4266)